MGCVSSKQVIRSRSCKDRNTAEQFLRSSSAHVHHGKHSGENKRNVSLRYNAGDDPLRMKSASSHHINGIPGCKRNDDFLIVDNKTEFELGVIEAKEWSSKINRKMNMMSCDEKSETGGGFRSPMEEPEMINTWELMAGLEEEEEDEPGIDRNDNNHSDSAVGIDHVNHHSQPSMGIEPNSSKASDTYEDAECNPIFSSARIEFAAGCSLTRDRTGPEDFEPHAAHLEPVGVDEEHGEVILKARVSDVDPDFLSAFREALEEYTPKNEFHLEMHGNTQQQQQEFTQQQQPSLSPPTKPQQRMKKQTTTTTSTNKERVVLYYTTLRGVRKTYEACCKLRLVLKALGVRVDERDLSMHSGYKDELKSRLNNDDIQLSKLPQLFLGNKYLGGAEELRQMNEDGRLEEALEGCEMIEDDDECLSPGAAGICEVCGDVRFVPCERCSGSCKIASAEKKNDSEEEDGCEVMEHQPQHMRCPDCNENGLVRCPMCCDD